MPYMLESSWCERCRRHFVNERALRQHKENSSMHSMCCGLDFETDEQMMQHAIDLHYSCLWCDEFWYDEEDLIEHQDEEHGRCVPCKRVFRTKGALTSHLRRSPNHFYCKDCNREFQSQSNLHSHLNSEHHRPKNVPCLLQDHCDALFVSHAAVILHLEAGTCPSGVTRKVLNRFVYLNDKTGAVTMLYDWKESRNIEDCYYRVGSKWKCGLCPRTFSNMQQVKQHLQGPRHEEKIFCCPNKNCKTEFSSLSGVFQHIEKGTCGSSSGRVIQKLLRTVLRNPEDMLDLL